MNIRRWIPVTEKLPEVSLNSVLGGDKSFKINSWQYMDIIAWMPLPDPYREGEIDERS